MPQKQRPMDDAALAAIIDEQVHDAVSWYGTDAAKIRLKAQKYFDGDETLDGDVPPLPGRSKVVSRDMSDVHGWIMPSLLRTFLSGDRVVIYAPRRQDAEAGAAQATDYVNYVFLSECSGYALLHSGMWDGLTHGNGIIKHWYDDSEGYETETFTGLPEMAYIKLVSDPAVEVLEHTERDDDTDNDALADKPGMDGALEPAAGSAAPPGGGAPGAPSPGSAAPDAAGGIAAPGIPAPGAGALEAPAGAAAGDAEPAGLALAAPKVHDLKIKREIEKCGLRVVAVPPEEFRIDRAATVLDEEHVRFCAHVQMRTRSDLIKDGYKRAQVDELSAGPTISDDLETNNRDRNLGVADLPTDRSTDRIEVWECYLQIDVDGDGVAEWRRVVTAEGGERQILLNEAWGDDLPFTDLVPDPMPHRWRGGSLFEELGDVQRTKTVLLRGINDNMYWVNNPMYEAVEGDVTPEGMDLLQSPEFGGVVKTRRQGSVTPLAVPFVADKLMQALELWDQVREFRTGVSASTMSLDPEALQNQTATAVNAAQTASYTKVETYARNIAELGLKRLFRCILRLIVKHQDKPRTIRLRGEWVDMDPRDWDADMDVSINVGLGSGSRDRDMGILQPIITKMETVISTLGPQAAAMLGMGPDRMFAAYRKFVEAGGIKQPDSFFPEIKPEQVQQLMQQMGSQPNPAMAEAQAKVQILQQESQARIQHLQAQTQALGIKTQSDTMKGQADAVKSQSDAQRGMLGIELDRAHIENLRAVAMANLAKAGAVQSDAQINQQLAHLEALDHLVGWHQQQQQIHHDAVGQAVSMHQDQQKIQLDHMHAMENMRQKVKTPGVDA